MVQNIRVAMPSNAMAFSIKPTDGQSNYCSSTMTLLAGSSCFINIGYAAKTVGAAGINLSLTYNNDLGAVPASAVSVSGVGLNDANLVVNPTVMNFGTATNPVLINTPMSQNITVTNTGGYKASGISWGTNNLNYVKITGGSCVGKSELAPQESCTVTLTFKAAVPGNFPYSFSATYDAALRALTANTVGTAYSGLASVWIATTAGECSAVCKAHGKINVPDEFGNYCTSGELVPASAAPVIRYYPYKCWGKSTNLNDYYCAPHGDQCGRSSGPYCYGVNIYDKSGPQKECLGTTGAPQKPDTDITDITMGCHCR